MACYIIVEIWFSLAMTEPSLAMRRHRRSYSAEGFSLQKFATATAAGNRPLAKEPCKTWRQAFRRQPRNCIREAASRSHFANENVETGQQALVDPYHQSILKRGPARRRRADDGVATEPPSAA